MNIHLTRPLEDYVKRRVAEGGYASVSEFVREAIRMMQANEKWKFERLQRLLEDGERSGIAAGYSVEKINALLDAEGTKGNAS